MSAAVTVQRYAPCPLISVRQTSGRSGSVISTRPHSLIVNCTLPRHLLQNEPRSAHALRQDRTCPRRYRALVAAHTVPIMLRAGGPGARGATGVASDLRPEVDHVAAW